MAANMKIDLKLALFSLCFLTIVKSQGDQLIIDVIYLPPDCPIKSQNGDYLTTHYTGTLENGTVFDTRFHFTSGIREIIFKHFIFLTALVEIHSLSP